MIVIKEFKTLSGYSKHHKIREKEVTEKNKEYLLLEAENKVKYNKYNKHLSSVATWYWHHHNTHTHIQTHTHTKENKCVQNHSRSNQNWISIVQYIDEFNMYVPNAIAYSEE